MNYYKMYFTDLEDIYVINFKNYYKCKYPVE